MRKRTFLIICVLLNFAISLSADDGSVHNSEWYSSTARILTPGKMDIGLFQPLRYGISDNVELSTHPLTDFVLPNFAVKWKHRYFKGFEISSRHSFYFPTPLLRLIAREGTGGIISPEFDIPNMFAFNNELLLTKEFTTLLNTTKIGFNFALNSDELDCRTTIDLPVVFPRLAVFYNNYGFRFGNEVIGDLSGRFNYLIDVDLFYNPNADEQLAFEHKGLLVWNKSSLFQIYLGYMLTYGDYPFGSQWHLLAPLIDLKWSWQIRN